MSRSASAAGSRTDADDAAECPISGSDVEVEYQDEEDMDIEEDTIDEIVEVEEEEDDFSGSPNSKDACKVQELEERDRTIGSGSSTTRAPEKAVLLSKFSLRESHDSQNICSLASGNMSIERENPCIRRHKDAPILKSEKPLNFVDDKRNQEAVVGDKSGVVSKSKLLHPMEQDVDSKDGQSGAMVAGPTNLILISTDVVSSMSRRYSSEGCFNGNMNSLEEVKKELLSESGKKRTASRSEALEMSGTSSSHCTDNNGKKRPALICDFFTKGWCIKGSKCRFLHVKEESGSLSQQPDGEVVAPNGKKVMEFDEGFMGASEMPISIGTTDKLLSAVGNMTSCSHVPSDTNDKLLLIQRENMSKSSSSISKQLFPFQNDAGSFQVAERGLGQHLLANDMAKSRGLVNPDIISSANSFLSLSNSQSMNKPSRVHGLEGVVCRSDYATDFQLPPTLNPTLNPSFNTLRRMTSDLSACHSSNWTRSVPFGSSSSASPLYAQKLFPGTPTWSVSSSFLASEQEKLLSDRLAGPRQHSAYHKTGLSSEDWEPSVPFKPSFCLTSSIISSLQDQYDPLRDSIDSPKVGERSSKLPFSAEGASALNATNHQTYGDSTSTATPIGECNGGKSTTSVMDTSHGVLNRCQSSQKDLHATEGKTDGNYEEGVPHGMMAKEEISSVASHIKGNSKVSKADIHGVTHHSDGSSSKRDFREKKLGRERRNNEPDVKQKLNGDASKLTKSSKHFRAALVDLIKEILRPLWQHGRISKDVHNTIVKRAEEKVLSTLQPHQIPSTADMAKQYISSSEAKISKLVEGYVVKYGKS